MSVVLIDPDGQTLEHGWRLSELRMLSRLDEPVLHDYLCRNMGYALLTIDSNQASLRFNPSLTTGPTLSAIFYSVADLGSRAIRVEWYVNATRYSHVCMDSKRAIDFVAALTEKHANKSSDRFYCRTVTVEDEPEAFRNLRRLFLNHTNNPVNELTIAYLKRRFAGRYVFVKRDRMAGQFVFADVGDGYTGLAESARSISVGKPIDDLYDREYGLFVAGAYREAAETGMPAIKDVDVIIHTHRNKSNALSYCRLILPLPDDMLLGVTVRNRDPIALED
jgi:hypothetical protein